MQLIYLLFGKLPLLQKLYYSLHFCIQGHYQNYNLQLYKATNTNRDKIYEVCLVLATEDINTACMHVGGEKVNFNAPH